MFSFTAELWFASPVLIALWVGQRLVSPKTGTLLSMVAGVVIVLLVIRTAEWLPYMGGLTAWLLLLASFAWAAGTMPLALRGGETARSSRRICLCSRLVAI